MTDLELLQLNREGFIPGPSESEEDFCNRVALVKKTFEIGEWIPTSHWDWVKICLRQMFDFEPSALPAFYSNESLRLWEGAAAWIEGRRIVSVQLRKTLQQGSYLGIYKREQILAHEAVHAARSAFDEPENEEFFAYMTSEQKWHRVFGPIVKRPWEIWPFFLAMMGGAFFSIAYLCAAIWASIGFYRLIRQHRRLRLAAERILDVVVDKVIARAILFRLTDDEILMFSKGEKIEDYRKKQKCLRWRLICLAYFKN
jgi:hypothetical protein